MKYNDILIGDVLNLDGVLERIVLLDQIRCLYDYVSIMNFKPTVLEKLSGTKYLFGHHTGMILYNNPEIVGHVPLNENEISVLRPDLPLRMGRHTELSWADVSQMRDYSKLLDYGQQYHQKLNIVSLFLEAFGPKGGLKYGKEIRAANNKALTVAEVIWKASQMQREIYHSREPGIGIYRIGIQNKKPLFYLWGYHDIPESTKRYEENYDYAAALKARMEYKHPFDFKPGEQFGILHLTFDESKVDIGSDVLKVMEIGGKRRTFKVLPIESSELTIDCSDIKENTYDLQIFDKENEFKCMKFISAFTLW